MIEVGRLYLHSLLLTSRSDFPLPFPFPSEDVTMEYVLLRFDKGPEAYRSARQSPSHLLHHPQWGRPSPVALSVSGALRRSYLARLRGSVGTLQRGSHTVSYGTQKMIQYSECTHLPLDASFAAKVISLLVPLLFLHHRPPGLIASPLSACDISPRCVYYSTSHSRPHLSLLRQLAHLFLPRHIPRSMSAALDANRTW
jgi:hypothetical protein